jgi:hypothetical protein
MSVKGIVALAAGLAIAVPFAAAAAMTPPSLRITSDAPLTVRGSGFRAQEAVQVTVTNGDQSWRKTARASRAGIFVVRWSSVRLDYCTLPVAVSARGAKTGTIRAKIPVRDCAAP